MIRLTAEVLLKEDEDMADLVDARTPLI